MTHKLGLGEACDPNRSGQCSTNLCVPLDSASGVCASDCSKDGKCPDDFVCDDAGKYGMVCKRSTHCTDDLGCPSGHRCDVATGACYIKVSRELCSPCTIDLQCPEGGSCFTVPATGERYCTTACGAGDECPTGFACKDVPIFAQGSTEPTSKKQCVPDNAAGTCEGGKGLCSPCKGDEECGGYRDLCVRNVVSGETFCGKDCDPAAATSCPDGFTCLDLSGQGQGPNQCVPVSNTCQDYCDSTDPAIQMQQCGLARSCDLANRLCQSATDGSECAACMTSRDCYNPALPDANSQCVMNDCPDCPDKGESFCAEPCLLDGDCTGRFGPGFACVAVGNAGKFCVPVRGTCRSGLGRLGDSCSTLGAADCVTGVCLSYGAQSLCSATCTADSQCGDPRQWRCCELAGDFYDCAQRNAAGDGPASGTGVCAPNGGLFGDDCRPGRAPCQSGTCLDIGTARLCTVPCGANGECPTDFVCRDAFAEGSATAIRICFPDGGGAPGSSCEFGPAACADRLCIKKDSGPICTKPCGEADTCPADWACDPSVLTVTGDRIQACLPPELQ